MEWKYFSSRAGMLWYWKDRAVEQRAQWVVLLFAENNNNDMNLVAVTYTTKNVWKWKGRGGGLAPSRSDVYVWLLALPWVTVGTTTVARKRSRSFCQKCRWQVTAKHAYTLRMWLCMMWHGAWLYGVHRTCAEMAAVSCGTSPASAVSTPLRWILKKHAIKS